MMEPEEERIPLKHRDFFHLEGSDYEEAHDAWNERRLGRFRVRGVKMRKKRKRCFSN